MEKEIFNIVYKYFEKREELNNEYIFDLVELLTCKNKLEKYIRNIDIDVFEALGSTLGVYSFSGNITIYLNNIIYYTNTYLKNMKYYNEADNLLYKYMLTLKMLLHEIEHAKQVKCVKEENNLESSILKISYERDLNDHTEEYKEEKFDRYYKLYYKYAPEERMAEHNATEIMKKVIKEVLNNINTNPVIYNKLNLYDPLEVYKRDKKKIVSPTLYYFSKMEYEDLMKDLPFYSSQELDMYNRCINMYNLDERYFLGLPISKEEYRLKKLKK